MEKRDREMLESLMVDLLDRVVEQEELRERERKAWENGATATNGVGWWRQAVLHRDGEEGK